MGPTPSSLFFHIFGHMAIQKGRRPSAASAKGGGLRPPPFVELFVDGHMSEKTGILSKILNLVRSPFIAEPISTFRTSKGHRNRTLLKVSRDSSKALLAVVPVSWEGPSPTSKKHPTTPINCFHHQKKEGV